MELFSFNTYGHTKRLILLCKAVMNAVEKLRYFSDCVCQPVCDRIEEFIKLSLQLVICVSSINDHRQVGILELVMNRHFIYVYIYIYSTIVV